MNGGDFYFIDEQAITASVYKVESNTSNSVSKEEILAKPVENITVVKDEATENAVKLELFELVDKIMLGELATGVGDDGFPQKVKHAVESGKNITSELIVEEIKEESVATIPQEVRVEIEKEAVAELGEDTKIQYMDICIMIKADDSELGTLSELQEELAITIAIPESLKGENYLYKVIRNHNGEITTLDTIDNGDGTITFKTDHFSTYALAYNEEKAVNPNGPAVPENPTNPNEPAVPEKPANPNEPAVPENPEKPDEPAVPENPGKTEESATSEEQQESVTQNPTSESPKTMDNNMLLVYACMIMCGILLKVVLNRKRV